MELSGLKINFLGDSITQGAATTEGHLFTELLRKDYGVIPNNYGIGGTRIARQQVPSSWYVLDLDFCKRMKEMDKTADAVVVLGGTNDFGHGDAPLGSPADRTPDTFYGACHYMMSYLVSEYPGKPVVICTPLHRADEDIVASMLSDGITSSRKTQHRLVEYVRIIKEVAAYYSLPVLDLWATSGLSPAASEVNRLLFADGLHPNDAGHAVIARKIAAFFRLL